MTSSKERNKENNSIRQGTTTSSAVVMSAGYSGPLPPASEFKRYDEVLPGAADRIIKMAEKSLDAEIKDAERHRTTVFIAMLFNKTVVYILLVISFILILLGKNIEALLAGIVPIIQVTSTIDFKK